MIKNDNLKKQIDNQIDSNKGKNLLSSQTRTSMHFINETIELSEKLTGLNPEEEEGLLDYVVNRSLKAFCSLNQYYTFTERQAFDLRNIYSNLFEKIRSIRGVTTKGHIEEIAQCHYRRLSTWLLESNSFALKIYPEIVDQIAPVTCFEYTPELQCEILRITTMNIVQPVLDIGCGSQGALVLYLRNNGIEAYGIDRFANGVPHLEKHDWLEYDYGKSKWGTIISNLGFSNHFIHHHLRSNGNFQAYAQKYSAILKALQPRGTFHYAPGLPFIEQYLDRKKFTILSDQIKGYQFSSVTITRKSR